MEDLHKRKRKTRTFSQSSYSEIIAEKENQSKMDAQIMENLKINAQNIADFQQALNLIKSVGFEIQSHIDQIRSQKKKTVNKEHFIKQNNQYVKAINGIKEILSKTLTETNISPTTTVQTPNASLTDVAMSNIETDANIIPSTSQPIIQKNKETPVRINGIVKFFDFKKGWGIINTTHDQTEHNVFVHRSSITKSKVANPRQRSLREGETVEFEVITRTVLDENGQTINKYDARNVTGPDFSNVKGAIIHIIFQKTQIRKNSTQENQNYYNSKSSNNAPRNFNQNQSSSYKSNISRNTGRNAYQPNSQQQYYPTQQNTRPHFFNPPPTYHQNKNNYFGSSRPNNSSRPYGSSHQNTSLRPNGSSRPNGFTNPRGPYQNQNQQNNSNYSRPNPRRNNYFNSSTNEFFRGGY
jgi:cold shock CspA family protein